MIKKQPLLRILNLEAGYDKLKILKGINITLKEGELAVIIGPNGSGKSTAVKSVFGITTNFGGSIRFNKQDITNWETHDIVKLGIGYVPQGRLVFDTLSVEENLEMGAFGMDSKLMEQRKLDIIKLFPVLKEKLKQNAGFLSGGQQQMLSIGRALMRRPKLILLDEPSLGLDPKTQKLIFKIIKDISNSGTTVMMVEQNAHQALKICTKAYVIENGTMAAVGGSELAKKSNIKKFYLGS